MTFIGDVSRDEMEYLESMSNELSEYKIKKASEHRRKINKNILNWLFKIRKDQDKYPKLNEIR